MLNYLTKWEGLRMIRYFSGFFRVWKFSLIPRMMVEKWYRNSWLIGAISELVCTIVRSDIFPARRTHPIDARFEKRGILGALPSKTISHFDITLSPPPLKEASPAPIMREQACLPRSRSAQSSLLRCVYPERGRDAGMGNHTFREPNGNKILFNQYKICNYPMRINFKAASFGLAENAAPPSRPNIPLEAQQSHLTIAKSRRLAGGRPTERPTMFAKFIPFWGLGFQNRTTYCFRGMNR